METDVAREMLRTWANTEMPRFSHEKPTTKSPTRVKIEILAERFVKRYGIFLAIVCIWTISLIVCSAIVHHNTERMVRQEMAVEYASRLEAYKKEQAEAEQAAHWLSGDASREAAINQSIDEVAKVIAKLSTDSQKLTEASCMLARVMSSAYPNSFQEVARQESQWMFYDPSANNTFSEHDRDLAELVVRPYMESGVIPNGLTDTLVYGEWTTNDFVLRDSYKTTSTMHTWRWS